MNDYQEKALVTCLPTCNNMVYAATELNATLMRAKSLKPKWMPRLSEWSRYSNSKQITNS